MTQTPEQFAHSPALGGSLLADKPLRAAWSWLRGKSAALTETRCTAHKHKTANLIILNVTSFLSSKSSQGAQRGKESAYGVGTGSASNLALCLSVPLVEPDCPHTQRTPLFVFTSLSVNTTDHVVLVQTILHILLCS